MVAMVHVRTCTCTCSSSHIRQHVVTQQGGEYIVGYDQQISYMATIVVMHSVFCVGVIDVGIMEKSYF